MSNLLALPFKRSSSIDIRDPVRNYIQNNTGTHPDEFKQDIARWLTLRRDALGTAVHVNTVDPILLYHAQLSSILSKISTDIQLDISYAPAFAPTNVPITLSNLAFERASVLFNLAALYCQLATSEDRAHMDGIKRATVNFQLSAGTFSYLLSSAIPKLIFPPDAQEIPLDLSESFLKSLERLMLAQAQECSWQMAKLNNYKNGVVARVAAQVATFYHQAYEIIRDADSPISHSFPSDWLPHIEAKWHHFDSVAQYRQSMDDVEARRYGHELARLSQAHKDAKTAFDAGKRGKISHTVLQDVQSLLDTLQKALKRAERDNDLIFHHDIPAISQLPPIKSAPLVSSTVPPGLSNPAAVLGNEPPLFASLLGWGAREAINIYNERKKQLLQEEIVGASQELQDNADHELRELNLPASLEALERPIGLPPSLLKRAEEVRSANGPTKLEASINDVQKLAHRDLMLLDEAMDVLDNEASEDEAARKNGPLDRLPSHEANTKLVEKQTRYRDLLTKASESDEHVRQKWEEWEPNIVALTWSEEDLEASVPQSTFSGSSPLTPEGKKTQALARALRVLLESLDDLHRERNNIVKRAQRLADADDISDRVLKEASKFDKMADMQPLMFEEASDEELAKYDKFLVELREFEEKQNSILADVKKQNELFLQSRRDDPTIKDREFGLQSLEFAYFKYKEISRNLEEGYKFYNDLAGLLINLKEECRAWTQQRRQEIHTLSHGIRTLSIRDTEADAEDADNDKKPPATAVIRKPKMGVSKTAVNLPSIHSNEWEFEEVQLPPGPKSRRT
ncbi:BRO1-like domain-containing protein [Amanita rubescens]|nr:BRO1-like domain-containing protein [Amanita rubescens]